MGSIIGVPVVVLFNWSGTFVFQGRWIKDPQKWSLSLDIEMFTWIHNISILGHCTGSLKVHMHQQCMSDFISIGNVI